jgi:hypothetical protein
MFWAMSSTKSHAVERGSRLISGAFFTLIIIIFCGILLWWSGGNSPSFFFICIQVSSASSFINRDAQTNSHFKMTLNAPRGWNAPGVASERAKPCFHMERSRACAWEHTRDWERYSGSFPRGAWERSSDT